jgi:hypothetical protein
MLKYTDLQTHKAMQISVLPSIMEAENSAETLVAFYRIIGRELPEDNSQLCEPQLSPEASFTLPSSSSSSSLSSSLNRISTFCPKNPGYIVRRGAGRWLSSLEFIVTGTYRLATCL